MDNDLIAKYHAYKLDDSGVKVPCVIEVYNELYPDLSYLGEYANKPDDKYITLDLVQENGYVDHNCYRYFVSCNYDNSGNFGERMRDLKYVRQDYKEYCNYGDTWYTIGIVILSYTKDFLFSPDTECLESLWGIYMEYGDIDKQIEDRLSEEFGNFEIVERIK